MLKRFFPLLAVVLLFSCSRDHKLSVSEYIAFVNNSENGFISNRTFNGVNYRSSMVTPEILAIRSGNRTTLTKKQFEDELKTRENKLNFVFTISDESGSNKVKEIVFNELAYSKILKYSNALINEDFKLLQGKDTIYCALVHLEPANSISPVLRLTIAFNGVNMKNPGDLTLFFNDNIFLNGPLKFHFNKELFTNKPEIIL
jgi:hypothetical protein